MEAKQVMAADMKEPKPSKVGEKVGEKFGEQLQSKSPDFKHEHLSYVNSIGTFTGRLHDLEINE